jgi:hypothetical protein
MRGLAEKVEMAAHELSPIVSVDYLGAIGKIVVEKFDFVNLLAEGDDGEIDSTTASMARFSGNVSFGNDSGLIDVGIEFSFSFVIFGLLAPPHEMIYCFLRTICIVDD